MSENSLSYSIVAPLFDETQRISAHTHQLRRHEALRAAIEFDLEDARHLVTILAGRIELEGVRPHQLDVI